MTDNFLKAVYDTAGWWEVFDEVRFTAIPTALLGITLGLNGKIDDQGITTGDLARINYPYLEPGNYYFLLRPNDLPTETSLVTVSSTGTHAYKKLSELVDTTSKQTIIGAKTWGTRTGSWYEVAEVGPQGLIAESGGKNPNVEVSPETYSRIRLGGLGINKSYKESGNATEYYSSFAFPTYKDGQSANYYFSIAPYDNPTADSVIVTGTNRKPVWKPLSEFIAGNNFNIANGTGQGSLLQKNVKSSDNTPYTNIASGSASIALGKNTKAQGNTDFVIGQNNTSDSSGSFVGGINCNNTDDSGYSIVFGDSVNNQYATKSVVMGSDIQNSNGNSIVLGSDLSNPLKNSVLIGRGLRSKDYLPFSSEDGITILGKYNKNATQGEDADGTSFIIGNGTSDTNRSNALKLSAAKGLECFIEPTTDNGVVRRLELKTKLNKPNNPQVESVLTIFPDGTEGTTPVSQFATTTTTPVTIPWTNLKTNEGILDQVRTVTTGLYEHSLYLRFLYNGWNAEAFMTLLSSTDTEITDYTGITNILGATFYHEASGIITNPVGDNKYSVGHIQNISHNGLKVLIPN